MTQIKTNKAKKANLNQVETLKNNPQIDDLDQFFADYSDFDNEERASFNPKAEKQPQQRKEFSIFNYQNHYEHELIKKEISQLTEQIHKEVKLLKKADESLKRDVKEVEKIALEEIPEKPGIYHVRFLEILLAMLRHMRENIGESRTWLKALMTRKKKRGSLFMALSKKKGTQYSLSQELQSSRSVQ